jgi:putative endonuclease
MRVKKQTANLLLARWGEKEAADYLSDNGYTIVQRNARTPYGEIDLVARCGETVVFVEVKTRSSTNYGLPEESITSSKREHMLSSAQAFMQANPDLGAHWRIDVIAIRRHPDRHRELVHFENAVSE